MFIYMLVWPFGRMKLGHVGLLPCRAQEQCESRGGRPGLPVSNSPYGLCGRKATLKNRAHWLCESRGGRPWLPVPKGLNCLCGRNATLNCSISELRSWVRVEVAVQGSTSLIVRTVSVDVKQH